MCASERVYTVGVVMQRVRCGYAVGAVQAVVEVVGISVE